MTAPSRRSRPDARLDGGTVNPLAEADFERPLHPATSRRAAQVAYGMLRLVLVMVVSLQLLAAVVVGQTTGSLLVPGILLGQAVVVTIVGFPLMMTLRVLLDAAQTVIADSYDQRESAHDARHGRD